MKAPGPFSACLVTFAASIAATAANPEPPPVVASSVAMSYDHGNPTDYEQYMLELVNASRTDPAGTAARLGIDLNQGLAPGKISTNAKAPLAMHKLLVDAARGHSDWMLTTGFFSHSGVTNSSPTDRAKSAGYNFPVGENIAYRNTSGAPDYFSMTRTIHESLVLSPGHRVNLMDGLFSVAGIGLRPGLFGGMNAFMATQNFSSGGDTEDSGPFILGVCYADANGNAAYDPGEGVPGVRVDTSLGNRYAVTSASGGFAIPIVPVETNTDTVSLPFAVGSDGSSWSNAMTYDANYRAQKLAAAPGQSVQVIWSGGPLAVPFTNQVTIRRPVRVNFLLRGTDSYAYDRTMVTAQNVKTDLLLGSAYAPLPFITSATNATGSAGSAFGYTITAANSPTAFGASNLPAGLSVDTATGVISGTPSAAGNWLVTLIASNAAGTGTGALNLNVAPAYIPPPPQPAPSLKKGKAKPKPKPKPKPKAKGKPKKR